MRMFGHLLVVAVVVGLIHLAHGQLTVVDATNPGHTEVPLHLGRFIVAGVGARMLTGSFAGFTVVFLVLLWLLGGL